MAQEWYAGPCIVVSWKGSDLVPGAPCFPAEQVGVSGKHLGFRDGNGSLLTIRRIPVPIFQGPHCLEGLFSKPMQRLQDVAANSER